MAKTIRISFSLRKLLVITFASAVVIAVYARERMDSLNQVAIITEFESSGGAYYENNQQPFRIGRFFGMAYPLDSVRLVKGPGRGDWWGVPGWKCSDEDTQLLEHFENLEEVYLAKSELGEKSFSRFATLSNLKEISLFKCTISGAALERCATSSSLRKLVLHSCNFEDVFLSKLKKSSPQIEIHVIDGFR